MNSNDHSQVCFITTRNVFNTSSLPKYAKIMNYKFDIIYWDQHDIDEDAGAVNHYRYKYPMVYGKSNLRKMIGYFKFRAFIKKVLKANGYEKLILLPTQTAILIFDVLLKRYSKKFIIDIRDYTAEYKKWFYFIEQLIINNAGIAVITSPAYEKFLPKHDYLISHNFTKIEEETIKIYRGREKSEKIVISCIGSIRFIEQFKKVINCFKNDDRFELRFVGRGSEHLKNFILENNIDNVILIERFENSRTLEFYLETDIIMNLYGNNNPFLDFALSNKLYYSAQLGIPILVCDNTYMEQVTKEYGFGFEFDMNNPHIKTNLYEYYDRINWNNFYESCDLFVKKVEDDEKKFMKRISEFISD